MARRKQGPRHLDARTKEGAAHRAKVGKRAFAAARRAYKAGKVTTAPTSLTGPVAVNAAYGKRVPAAPTNDLRAIGALRNAVTALRQGERITAVKFASLALAHMAGDLPPEGQQREEIQRDIVAKAMATLRKTSALGDA